MPEQQQATKQQMLAAFCFDILRTVPQSDEESIKSLRDTAAKTLEATIIAEAEVEAAWAKA